METLIDLTDGGPDDSDIAITSVVTCPIKIEQDDELPPYNVEGDLPDFEDDTWQIDEQDRQLEAEMGMQGMEEPALTVQNSLTESPWSFYGLDSTSVEEPIVIDSDAEDAEAIAIFQEKKDAYCQRAVEGLTSFDEDIDYQKAEQAEQQRIRRRQNNVIYSNALEAEEKGMFFPHDDILLSPTRNHPEITDSEMATLLKTNTFEPNLVEDRFSPSSKFKKLEATRQATKKLPNSGIKKSRPVKKAAHKSNKHLIGYTNIDSLLRNNTIADAQANKNKGYQPGFKSKNKKNALAELISSLPEDQRSTHRVDRKELDNATRKFNGKGAMRADGRGGWLLKGMESSLTHFQLLGVGWMRDRENSASKPFGGFVSDDMGLGKTIQTIANILDGRPLKKTENTSATLIVAPAGLLRQWKHEIIKHTKNDSLGPVLVYRSGTRIDSSDPVATLSNNGVVITSYHEVLRSWPKNEPPPELHTPRAKSEWYEKICQENKGDLHKVKWRRIVLDEAQAIKNWESRTSEACCQLVGKYRWAVSGTPIQNRLEEFYAYWRFLELPHTGSYELFKVNFCKRKSEQSMLRIQTYLGKFMLRRTHADQLFGQPILKLPEITSRTEIVEFNQVEKAIYRIVVHRFVEKIRACSTAEKERQYRSWLVLLLRLRQLVGHVLLIQKTLKGLLEQPDLERLWNLTKDPSIKSGKELLPGLEKALKSAQQGTGALEPDKSEQSASSYYQAANSVAKDSGPAHRFRKYLQSLRDDGKWAEINERSICQCCKNPPSNPYITSCCHLICHSCLAELERYASINKENMMRCLECGLTFEKAEPCNCFEDAGSNRATPVSVRPGLLKQGFQGGEETETDWITLGGSVLHPAKTSATVKQIKKWLEEDNQPKIICFTQFAGIIKILSQCCRENEWGHTSFHGNMSFEARDRSIDQFSCDPECHLLLAGLKAGGTGLNLTQANRVIIIDLWWNQSVETQAFCRVYRIGQERPVDLVRFVVKDSIDEEIVRMQESKNREIDGAIDGAIEAKNRSANLTTAELLSLFGNLERDDRSEMVAGSYDEPFIFSNDPYGAA